jgi:hypothetical protein
LVGQVRDAVGIRVRARHVDVAPDDRGLRPVEHLVDGAAVPPAAGAEAQPGPERGLNLHRPGPEIDEAGHVFAGLPVHRFGLVERRVVEHRGVDQELLFRNREPQQTRTGVLAREAHGAGQPEAGLEEPYGHRDPQALAAHREGLDEHFQAGQRQPGLRLARIRGDHHRRHIDAPAGYAPGDVQVGAAGQVLLDVHGPARVEEDQRADAHRTCHRRRQHDCAHHSSHEKRLFRVHQGSPSAT